MEIDMNLCPKASLKKSCILSARVAVPEGFIESAKENATLAIRIYFRPITRRSLRGIGNGKTRRVKGYIFIILISQTEDTHTETLLQKIFIKNENKKRFLNFAHLLSCNENNRLFKTLMH